MAPRESARRGFTLIELMLAVGVIGVLASAAIVNYARYVEKARTARTIAELKSISRVIDGLYLDGEGDLPAALADADIGQMKDPWGSDYQYLRIAGGLPPGVRTNGSGLPHVAAPPGGGGGGSPVIAQARKDQFLVPINSDYDLYSKGPDGKSKPSLNTPDSRDDIIRARDGAYVGIAEGF